MSSQGHLQVDDAALDRRGRGLSSILHTQLAQNVGQRPPPAVAAHLPAAALAQPRQVAVVRQNPVQYG